MGRLVLSGGVGAASRREVWGDKEDKGKKLLPYAQCPMPNAQCPIPSQQSTVNSQQ